MRHDTVCRCAVNGRQSVSPTSAAYIHRLRWFKLHRCFRQRASPFSCPEQQRCYYVTRNEVAQPPKKSRMLSGRRRTFAPDVHSLYGRPTATHYTKQRCQLLKI